MENALSKQIKKENKCNKGAVVGQIIGLTIAIIIILAISIPIINQVIEDECFTGILATVVGLIPLFLALAALITTVAIISGA